MQDDGDEHQHPQPRPHPEAAGDGHAVEEGVQREPEQRGHTRAPAHPVGLLPEMEMRRESVLSEMHEDVSREHDQADEAEDHDKEAHIHDHNEPTESH